MKIKEKLTNIGTKIMRKKNELMLCAMTLPATASMTAFAEGEGAGQAKSIITEALQWILNIVAAGGIVFAIYGAIKLVMAYRDQNPDAQNAAVKDIVIGAALVVIRLLYGVVISVINI